MSKRFSFDTILFSIAISLVMSIFMYKFFVSDKSAIESLRDTGRTVLYPKATYIEYMLNERLNEDKDRLNNTIFTEKNKDNADNIIKIFSKLTAQCRDRKKGDVRKYGIICNIKFDRNRQNNDLIAERIEAMGMSSVSIKNDDSTAVTDDNSTIVIRLYGANILLLEKLGMLDSDYQGIVGIGLGVSATDTDKDKSYYLDKMQFIVDFKEDVVDIDMGMVFFNQNDVINLSISIANDDNFKQFISPFFHQYTKDGTYSFSSLDKLGNIELSEYDLPLMIKSVTISFKKVNSMEPVDLSLDSNENLHEKFMSNFGTFMNNNGDYLVDSYGNPMYDKIKRNFRDYYENDKSDVSISFKLNEELSINDLKNSDMTVRKVLEKTTVTID